MVAWMAALRQLDDSWMALHSSFNSSWMAAWVTAALRPPPRLTGARDVLPKICSLNPQKIIIPRIHDKIINKIIHRSQHMPSQFHRSETLFVSSALSVGRYRREYDSGAAATLLAMKYHATGGSEPSHQQKFLKFCDRIARVFVPVPWLLRCPRTASSPDVERTPVFLCDLTTSALASSHGPASFAPTG